MEGKSRSVGKGMYGTIIIGASGYLTLKANARDDFHLCIFFLAVLMQKNTLAQQNSLQKKRRIKNTCHTNL